MEEKKQLTECDDYPMFSFKKFSAREGNFKVVPFVADTQESVSNMNLRKQDTTKLINKFEL